jgi:hypothetical protein
MSLVGPPNILPPNDNTKTKNKCAKKDEALLKEYKGKNVEG